MNSKTSIFAPFTGASKTIPEMLPLLLAGGVLSPPSPPPHALNKRDVSVRPNVNFSVFLANIVIWKNIFCRDYIIVKYFLNVTITPF
ncbi:TPA: hypothetical protein ACVO34_004315, partial [Vibrio diabolicus]